MSELLQINGNIGSGKTTLIELLKTEIDDLIVVPEPVEHWRKVTDSKGENMLQAFYRDPTKYACTFQIFALTSRMMEMFKATTNNTSKIFLSERGPSTDKNVFAKNAYESGLMTELEFKVYQDIYDTLPSLLPFKIQTDFYIYIRASPQTCLERINKRARPEEKDKISLSYLESLHKYHEEWLAKLPGTIIIDGEKDYDSDEGKAEIKKVIDHIKERLNKEMR